MSNAVEPKRTSFWRDVLVQFLGTILAAAFLYFWAVVLGYLQRPETLAVVLVTIWGLLMLIGAIVTFQVTRRTRRFLTRRGWFEVFVSLANYCLGTVIMLAFCGIGYLIIRFVPYAIFRQ